MRRASSVAWMIAERAAAVEKHDALHERGKLFTSRSLSPCASNSPRTTHAQRSSRVAIRRRHDCSAPKCSRAPWQPPPCPLPRAICAGRARSRRVSPQRDRSGYLETLYGTRNSYNGGTIIRLDAGQAKSDLNFKLTPAGAVAGTIRDSDGEPIESATVELGQIVYGDRGKPRS